MAIFGGPRMVALGDPGEFIFSESSKTLMKSSMYISPEVFMDLYSLTLISSNLANLSLGLSSLLVSPSLSSTTVGSPLM